MASTYTANAGIEKPGTGEQSGTWGTTTNTNFDIIDRAMNGVGAISLSGTTHTLTTTDGALSDGGYRVLVLGGSPSGTNTITIDPNDQDKTYLVYNNSGQSAIFTQGSGGNATVANGEYAWIYADGAGASAAVAKTATELSTDTSPVLGGNLDLNSNTVQGTGTINITGNITGTNLAGAGAGITGVKQPGKETIWVPVTAMYPNTTDGCAFATQVELSNGPEIKVMDFDPSSVEHAQFTVAFPKSWNEGTVTYRVYFTVTGTNTGDVIWGMNALAVADNDPLDTAFGSAVQVTKAHSGTSNDLDVSDESSAITIAGSPSVNEQVYFQLYRNASDAGDTQTGDARLLGVQIFFTTDAANDA